VAVTEDSSDLRWCGTLPGELADLVDNLVGGDLEPCGSGARVGDGGSGDTLSVAVHATHVELCVRSYRLGKEDVVFVVGVGAGGERRR